MSKVNKPTEAMMNLMSKAGSDNPEIAKAGITELVTALQVPLREAIFPGDITDFFTVDMKKPGSTNDYPLDLVVPGREGEHRAYYIPAFGKLPERRVEGSFLTIPTYEVGSSVTIPMKYIRDAGWLTMKNYMNILEGSFVMKNNTDAWRLVVSAAVGRSLTVYDDAVLPGYTSKALVALAQVAMMRNAGGNTSSVNRGKLSRLYVSPESVGDIRNWDLTQLDDVTRKTFFDGGDVDVLKVMGTDVHSIVELGVGGEMQTYFSVNLAQSFQSYTYTGSGGGTKTKVEFGIGVDLTRDNTFIKPVRAEITLEEDITTRPKRMLSIYGYGEHGFGVTDTRRTLLIQI